MKIKNEELGIISEALEAGIEARRAASKRDGTSKICREVDKGIIVEMQKIVMRVERSKNRIKEIWLKIREEKKWKEN